MEHPHRHVFPDSIAGELDLTKRQVITALHGLSEGLGDSLQLAAGGSWIYIPPDQHRFDAADSMEVPVGWERNMRIVARIGEQYVLQVLNGDGSPNGVLFWASPLVGPIRWLTERGVAQAAS